MDSSRKKLQAKRRPKVSDVLLSPSPPSSGPDPRSNPFLPSDQAQPPAFPQKKNQTSFKFLPVGHFDAFPFQPPEQSPNKTNDNTTTNASTHNAPPQSHLVNIDDFNRLMQYGRSLEQSYVQLQAQLNSKEIDLQEVQQLRKVDHLDFTDIMQNTLKTLLKLNSLLEEQSNVNIDKDIENLLSKLSIQNDNDTQNNNNNSHPQRNYDSEAIHELRVNFQKKAQQQTELLEERIKQLKKQNSDIKLEHSNLEKKVKVFGPNGKDLLRNSSIVELHKLLTEQRDAYRIIEDEIEKKTMEEKACVVCLDKDKNTVFVPCGHLVTCWVCSRSLRECPICRQEIQQSIRTYLS